MSNIISLLIEPVFTRYYNEENNYGVVICWDLSTRHIDKGALGEDMVVYDRITVVGNMPKLVIGKEYKCKVESIVHPTYGEQFNLLMIESNEGSTREDEIALLEELLPPVMWSNVIKAYDLPVTAIIEGTFDYNIIKGMNKERFDRLCESVQKDNHYMRALAELGKYGISFKIVKQLVDKYGSGELAVEKVLIDPYILYKDINGIGFHKADVIARTMGFSLIDTHRIFAGIVYAMELEELAGNTWAYMNMVRETAESELEVLIPSFDDIVKLSWRFYVEENKMSMIYIYNCEKDIAIEMLRLKKFDQALFYDIDVSREIDRLEDELNIQYSEKQKEIFYHINKSNVVVLEGVAGSGKSTVVNGCLKMILKKVLNPMLVSPTAKAAKVLSNSTNMKATTIHRCLKWMPSGFVYNQFNKLDCDLMVIDEMSMVDIYLFRSLLQALPDGCRLLLVGDPAQLESISVGSVLRDIVRSGKIPVVSLTEVFRQALDSGILFAANEILNGKKFYSDAEVCEYGIKKDCKIWFGEKDVALSRLVYLYKALLKLWNVEDILVITPMKKSDTGVINLNKVLQHVYNPEDESKNEIVLERCTFRESDKVRHTKNKYDAMWFRSEDGYYIESSEDRGVFNGDFGVIIEIDNDKGLVFVDYEDKIIMYKKSSKDLNSLELAYAITCHSAQGSQSPVVIGLMNISHYMNLKRNLLYTLTTRAANSLYMLAERRAFGMAIKNDTIANKQTHLEKLLIDIL